MTDFPVDFPASADDGWPASSPRHASANSAKARSTKHACTWNHRIAPMIMAWTITFGSVNQCTERTEANWKSDPYLWQTHGEMNSLYENTKLQQSFKFVGSSQTEHWTRMVAPWSARSVFIWDTHAHTHTRAKSLARFLEANCSCNIADVWWSREDCSKLWTYVVDFGRRKILIQKLWRLGARLRDAREVHPGPYYVRRIFATF